MNTKKKWGRGLLIMTLAALVVLGAFTALIDPAFHYHKPLNGIDYYIFDQRYQNDGIVKHFAYDAIITGTSMTENARPSELEALFGVNAIKVPFSGSSFRELHDNLHRAFQANPGIKMVVMGLDGADLMDDKDVLRSDVPLPVYLYDENPFNDVSYLLNKEILLKYTMRMLQQTYYGVGTTSFDDYSYWWGVYDYGPEAVLKNHTRPERAEASVPMDPETAEKVRENIRQNVVSLAKENPNTTFYYYFSPYCAVFWDMQYSAGNLEKQVEAYRIATEELLQCENIRVYSFYDKYEWTENLEQYQDFYHHSADINSQILKALPGDEYLLTEETYAGHWQQVLKHYQNFDYEEFYRQYGWPAD